MSDELRLARDSLRNMVHGMPKEPRSSYEVWVVRLILVLSELCAAVQNLEDEMNVYDPETDRTTGKSW